MKDIDFDELDKAVNRFLNEDTAEKKQIISTPEKVEEVKVAEVEAVPEIEPEVAKQPARTAKELHGRPTGFGDSQAPRAGRFMDIMRPSQISAPAPTVKSTPENIEAQTPSADTKVVKNPADLVENLSDSVHQRRVRKTAPKGLNEELEVASNVNYEQPVLEAVEIAELPKPALAPSFDALKAQQALPAEDISVDNPEADIEAKTSDDTKFVEPFLGEANLEKPDLSDEIITSGAPGLTQIEDDDDMLVYGKTHETVRERINRQAIEEIKDDIAPKITDENPAKTDSAASVNIAEAEIEKAEETPEVKKPFTVNEEPETPLTTPFLPNARVEKRPLGASPAAHNNLVENTESRLVNSGPIKETKKSANSRESVPILNSDEYSSPIVARPKRKSGWGIVFAILGIIIVGALGGLLAWYLLIG